MPAVQLVTNVKTPDAKLFALKFSKFSVEVLGKPESYITADIQYNETLTFAGTFDPALTLTVTSLDNINPDANEAYSKKFFDFFKQELGVPGDRGYIYKGTTFASIFGKK
ncbi:Tautomerase/MIF [Infundibulicybe gibba]|nr:Tautomerase/MIF [Infundibulicybe gibba]